VIEEDQCGPSRLRNGGNLFHLTLADQRGRIRSWPSLEHFSYHFRPSAGDQLAKFCEGRIPVGSVMFSTRCAGVGRGTGEFGGFSCKCSRAR
jgi:hypothetical protein